MVGRTVKWGYSVGTLLALGYLAGCMTSPEPVREGGPDGSLGGRIATGDEGGACYGNGSCNGVLTCASALCVDLTPATGLDGSLDATADGLLDAEASRDAETVDSHLTEAAVTDANVTDANVTDANVTDADVTDAAVVDATVIDAEIADAAADTTRDAASDSALDSDAGVDAAMDPIPDQDAGAPGAWDCEAAINEIGTIDVPSRTVLTVKGGPVGDLPCDTDVGNDRNDLWWSVHSFTLAEPAVVTFDHNDIRLAFVSRCDEVILECDNPHSEFPLEAGTYSFVTYNLGGAVGNSKYALDLVANVPDPVDLGCESAAPYTVGSIALTGEPLYFKYTHASAHNYMLTGLSSGILGPREDIVLTVQEDCDSDPFATVTLQSNTQNAVQQLAVSQRTYVFRIVGPPGISANIGLTPFTE